MSIPGDERIDLGALRAGARDAVLRARIAATVGTAPRALPSRFQLGVERYAFMAASVALASVAVAALVLRGAPARPGGEAGDWRGVIATAASETRRVDARDAYLMMRGGQ